ncbi:Protein FAM63A, partial [Lamprotornis superbus]
PGVPRESPAPAGEGSGQQDGVSSPEGPPGGSPELQPPLGPPPAVPGAPRAQPQSRDEDFYCVKWITWKGERTPVVTQSENGPCPLLAIINILLLQWKASGVKLPPQKEVITAEELMAHLGNCILATQPRDTSEGLQLNFQQVRSNPRTPNPTVRELGWLQDLGDTMTVLPKLSTGLDVNVRFTGVSDFEYTPECIIPEQVQAVGKLSYNQLVEKIITCKQASDSSLVSEGNALLPPRGPWGTAGHPQSHRGPVPVLVPVPVPAGLVAEQFLEATASQLTFHGLCELTARAREGELGVFFRNNHFSTMIKHKGHLYLLVTDQGFLHEEGVVWESLHSVDGDSCFCDTEFHLSHAPGKDGATAAPPDPRLQQRQVDQVGDKRSTGDPAGFGLAVLTPPPVCASPTCQDYMVALSLQQGQDPPSVLSDLELARQLQHEEYQQHHPHPHPAPPQLLPAQAGGRPVGERRQRQRPDLDCTLL